MQVTINNITPVFNADGTLELQSMSCTVSGGEYPEAINGGVLLTKADGITLTSTKSDVQQVAIAKFKANVDAMLAPQADQQPAK
ncbi:hypothetical protein [Periweissella ghanensis]|uniref:Uncharacterized protein n=1 Tax=Periweissella ghanensis TaxID=467997 RepID=A0ABM8ZCZ9_9LACO|nr:hypothetical protein [Periweissella ghanensis]MCM0601413.1 hypothetical protein [Periweissella ghanensis]CAH0419473.1 hypothetical protein WGH24286_01932 [Periweissella ghanensis]